jgi:hypothetical protein
MQRRVPPVLFFARAFHFFERVIDALSQLPDPEPEFSCVVELPFQSSWVELGSSKLGAEALAIGRRRADAVYDLGSVFHCVDQLYKGHSWLIVVCLSWAI